jgi:hypothetical protein
MKRTIPTAAHKPPMFRLQTAILGFLIPPSFHGN